MPGGATTESGRVPLVVPTEPPTGDEATTGGQRPSKPTAPQLGGRYQLGEPLGAGRRTEVLAGYDTLLRRPVAVRRLRAEWADDPGAIERFSVEARESARVSHPDVVAVYDSGHHDGQPFLVMELLSGATLDDELRSGPLTPERACLVVGRVLAGLAAAHRQGIVHGCVGPSAVLSGDRADVRLGRFGRVASRVDAAASPDLVPTIDDDLEAAARLLADALAPDLPSPLATVVERSLDPDESRRYPTAMAFGQALVAARAALERAASAVPPPTAAAATTAVAAAPTTVLPLVKGPMGGRIPPAGVRPAAAFNAARTNVLPRTASTRPATPPAAATAAPAKRAAVPPTGQAARATRPQARPPSPTSTTRTRARHNGRPVARRHRVVWALAMVALALVLLLVAALLRPGDGNPGPRVPTTTAGAPTSVGSTVPSSSVVPATSAASASAPSSTTTSRRATTSTGATSSGAGPGGNSPPTPPGKGQQKKETRDQG